MTHEFIILQAQPQPNLFFLFIFFICQSYSDPTFPV